MNDAEICVLLRALFWYEDDLLNVDKAFSSDQDKETLEITRKLRRELSEELKKRTGI